MEANRKIVEDSKDEAQLLAECNNPSLSTEEREKALLTLTQQYTQSGLTDKVQDSETRAIELVLAKKILEWSVRENKNFLKFRLQIRLANILYLRGEFSSARKEIEEVIKEAKDVDDKNLLVESHLLEAKLIYESQNIAKAKAALTACRANANKIYIQPVLHADIEKTAGILHLAEKDYRIAYSYFYEAFEAFHTNGEKKTALETFQYMLLAKIMQDSIDDANNIVQGRYGQIYSNDSGLMIEILNAYKTKTLVDLAQILNNRRAEISKNRIIMSQIDFLYDQLLEKNIQKLITAYSKVQIRYLASKLKIEDDAIERKVGEMILDEKLLGSLDQENGVLILFENKAVDPMFKDSLEVFENLNQALDELAIRSEKLKVN